MNEQISTSSKKTIEGVRDVEGWGKISKDRGEKSGWNPRVEQNQVGDCDENNC